MSQRARRMVAEAVGTFFLVLIGPGSVMVDAYSGGAVTHVGIGLAFAFVVTAMIYALGHLSGARINPVADGFAAIAVGLTVGFCALFGGPLTGASMNPARSLGRPWRGISGGRTGSTGWPRSRR